MGLLGIDLTNATKVGVDHESLFEGGGVQELLCDNEGGGFMEKLGREWVEQGDIMGSMRTDRLVYRRWGWGYLLVLHPRT